MEVSDQSGLNVHRAVRSCRTVISGDMHSVARIEAALRHNLKLKTRSRGIKVGRASVEKAQSTGSVAYFVFENKIVLMVYKMKNQRVYTDLSYCQHIL